MFQYQHAMYQRIRNMPKAYPYAIIPLALATPLQGFAFCYWKESFRECNWWRTFLKYFNWAQAFLKYFLYICKNLILAKIPLREAAIVRWYIYIERRTFLRFGFDVLELRKFKLSVKSKATGTPLKGVFKAPALSLGISMPCVNVGRLSYIGVGLSALLVSTDRGNAKALTRGTSLKAGSTLFYIDI